MSAIPADLRELYDAAASVAEAAPGLWIPNAAPRVVELIQRIAILEERNRVLDAANSVMRVRFAARRAALDATEQEKAAL